MRNPSDETRHDSRGTAEDAAHAEDFLFHLHRGSEMLLKNKVLEAKEELERALAHQPQDAKSQDLLAGVYFRLGVYPRAIEIWSALVSAYPGDPTLRVNLALAYFKIGLVDEALEHVNAALRIHPDHERAWGYLGLIHWRRGRIPDARDAFLRAGQSSMARRMEELLEEAAADEEAEAERNRAAAEDAARAIEDGPAQRPAYATRPGRSSLVPPPDAELARGPQQNGLAAWSAAARIPDGAVGPVHRADDGTVTIRSAIGFALRADVALAVASAADGRPVHRRSNGVDVDAVLGASRPVLRFGGSVDAVLRPLPGKALVVVALEGEELVVAESRLVGFSPTLDVDSSSIALPTDELVLARLSGKGHVVLLADAPVRALVVAPGRDVRAKHSALLAYSGGVTASASTGVSTLAVVLRGDGTAFVT